MSLCPESGMVFFDLYSTTDLFPKFYSTESVFPNLYSINVRSIYSFCCNFRRLPR